MSLLFVTLVIQNIGTRDLREELQLRSINNFPCQFRCDVLLIVLNFTYELNTDKKNLISRYIRLKQKIIYFVAIFLTTFQQLQAPAFFRWLKYFSRRKDFRSLKKNPIVLLQASITGTSRFHNTNISLFTLFGLPSSSLLPYLTQRFGR